MTWSAKGYQVRCILAAAPDVRPVMDMELTATSTHLAAVTGAPQSILAPFLPLRRLQIFAIRHSRQFALAHLLAVVGLDVWRGSSVHLLLPTWSAAWRDRRAEAASREHLRSARPGRNPHRLITFLADERRKRLPGYRRNLIWVAPRRISFDDLGSRYGGRPIQDGRFVIGDGNNVPEPCRCFVHAAAPCLARRLASNSSSGVAFASFMRMGQ